VHRQARPLTTRPNANRALTPTGTSTTRYSDRNPPSGGELRGGILGICGILVRFFPKWCSDARHLLGRSDRAGRLLGAAVAGDRVTVVGGSRGGELALLLGATFPDVEAVVGVAPGGVVTFGLGRNPFCFCFFRSSWSLAGRPVAFVPMRLTARVLREIASPIVTRRPIEIRVFYDVALEKAKELAAATIPLLSCELPRMWSLFRPSQFPCGDLDRAPAHRAHSDHGRNKAEERARLGGRLVTVAGLSRKAEARREPIRRGFGFERTPALARRAGSFRRLGGSPMCRITQAVESRYVSKKGEKGTKGSPVFKCGGGCWRVPTAP
jgi:pimeloyl-ACP methyl ester carboxylesterase